MLLASLKQSDGSVHRRYDNTEQLSGRKLNQRLDSTFLPWVKGTGDWGLGNECQQQCVATIAKKRSPENSNRQ
ncbi:hypothetical protein [Nostoc sp. 2RC]|uniref:hypothetical protein n=1 Tax=Nostoc sp. 2RC TaxID=2485484 RepID=UPI00162774C4|nr:hypothetical protein [Nostoc sp. 2RC]MBC1240378.1 hypothetical protein [Nostoc sp. 2RC]